MFEITSMFCDRVWVGGLFCFVASWASAEAEIFRIDCDSEEVSSIGSNGRGRFFLLAEALS